MSSTFYQSDPVLPGTEVPWRRVVVVPLGGFLLNDYYWRVPVWDPRYVKQVARQIAVGGILILAFDPWRMQDMARAEEWCWKDVGHISSLTFYGQYDRTTQVAAQLVASCSPEGTASVHIFGLDYFKSFGTRADAWTTAMRDLAGFTGRQLDFDDTTANPIALASGVSSNKFDEIVVVTGRDTWSPLYPRFEFVYTSYALKG